MSRRFWVLGVIFLTACSPAQVRGVGTGFMLAGAGVGYVGAVGADRCLLAKEASRDGCREQNPPHHTQGTTILMASGLAGLLVGAALTAGASRPHHRGAPKPWPLKHRPPAP